MFLLCPSELEEFLKVVSCSHTGSEFHPKTNLISIEVRRKIVINKIKENASYKKKFLFTIFILERRYA